MKKILTLLTIVIMSSCTKSIVEAPEQTKTEQVKDIKRAQTLMVSPDFVKGSDNQVLTNK